MEVGYFKDDVRYMGFQGKQKAFEYQITAESDGEYYPCFQNLCAGYIVATKISVSS